MSVIVKFAEDRLVELDVEEISAEEAEASGAPVVDKTEEVAAEPESEDESGRSLFRLLALFALLVGAALAAGKLRGGPDIGEEIEIETDLDDTDDTDETELEN